MNEVMSWIGAGEYVPMCKSNEVRAIAWYSILYWCCCWCCGGIKGMSNDECYCGNVFRSFGKFVITAREKILLWIIQRAKKDLSFGWCNADDDDNKEMMLLMLGKSNNVNFHLTRQDKLCWEGGCGEAQENDAIPMPTSSHFYIYSFDLSLNRIPRHNQSSESVGKFF